MDRMCNYEVLAEISDAKAIISVSKCDFVCISSVFSDIMGVAMRFDLKLSTAKRGSRIN